MKISAVLPVYNESKSIDELYARLNKLSENERQYSFEFIFVNDFSSDDTVALLSAIAEKDKRVKIIDFSRNFGQQIAFTAGYDMATGDAVVTMDSDLQDPPELISQFLRFWERGCEIVYARRLLRDDGFLKKITANLYYRLLDHFSDLKIPRNVGDFRLIDKKVLTELNQCREKFRYLRGMVAWLGFKHTFVDFQRPNRQHGETAYTWTKMFKLAFDGLTGFTMLPLKLASYVGTVVMVASFFLFAVGFFDFVLNHRTYPLFLWLINIMFCFMGVQFLLFGFLGEYIGRIHDETKRRPLYVINKKINF